MSHEARYAASPGVMSRRLKDEVILLDLKKGAYYGLDGPGALAWSMLADGRSTVEIEAAIGAEFDAEAEVVRDDLADLLEDLRAKRLIEPAGITG